LYIYNDNFEGFIMTFFRLGLTSNLLVLCFLYSGYSIADSINKCSSSNHNKGVSCTLASKTKSNRDWGRAPKSYGTLFIDNGPRHELSENLYLGTNLPDAESDGKPYADNDDSSIDDDGIGFVTPTEIGYDGEIQVTVAGSGYLHGWIDWNGDGDFNNVTEKVISAEPLTTGKHLLSYLVPPHAEAGKTWARFRYSSAVEMLPIGAALDGEVEDYLISIRNPDYKGLNKKFRFKRKYNNKSKRRYYSPSVIKRATPAL